jgi:hypothetical protein
VLRIDDVALTGSLIETVAEDFHRVVDRRGRLFATHGRDSAAVAQRHLQGLTQAERSTFAGMADVVERGASPSNFSIHQQLAVVP